MVFPVPLLPHFRRVFLIDERDGDLASELAKKCFCPLLHDLMACAVPHDQREDLFPGEQACQLLLIVHGADDAFLFERPIRMDECDACFIPSGINGAEKSLHGRSTSTSMVSGPFV